MKMTTMAVDSTKLSLCVIFFFPSIMAFTASTCNVTGDDKTQRENITVVENTQINFTHELQSVTKEKFRIDVKVCQDALLQRVCACRWFAVYKPKCSNDNNNFTCEADNSGMRMSFLVKRTHSDIFWMSLSHASAPALLKHTQLQVTYPPKITQLFVNGDQVDGTHIIDEEQQINISCVFTNGNPPATIRLLNDTGHTLSSTTNTKGPLVVFIGVYHCHDSWPTLSCEAPGSELNRSVNILVRCPPRLTLLSTQVVELTSLADGLSVGIRSYTSNITKYLMKSDSGETIREVTYELSGHPPKFNLTLRLGPKSWIGLGNWTLKVENEFGYTSITFEFINKITQTLAGVRKQSKAFRLKADPSPSSEDPQESVTTLAIISGCLLSITAASVGILLLCVIKMRHGVWGTRRSRTVAFGAELMEPTPSPRRADGLIYGELEFSDRTPSNVIIGSLPNTQYAQIQFTDSDYPSQK